MYVCKPFHIEKKMSPSSSHEPSYEVIELFLTDAWPFGMSGVNSKPKRTSV